MFLFYLIGISCLPSLIRTDNLNDILEEENLNSVENDRPDSENFQLRSEDKAPLKVGIIGSGISGLFAALILQDLGIDYEILEADKRSGGRIYTHYFDTKYPEDSIQSKFSYYDVGAMRFPNITVMSRLLGGHDYSLINYLKRSVKPEYQINLKPYIKQHENNFVYYNGIKLYTTDDHNGDPLQFGKKYGGKVPDEYAEVDYSFWYEAAFKNLISQIQNEKNYKVLLDADRQSTRAYLNSFKHDSLGDKTPYPLIVIDWLESLGSSTGGYDLALSENLFDSIAFNTMADEPVDWYLIEGGSTKLIKAMESILKNKPQLNNRVDSFYPVGKKVGVGIENKKHQIYDHVISTVPLGVLNTEIETDQCNFTRGKTIAMRLLNYDESVKVAFVFKTRWWENSTVMEGRPIFGGETGTDLPIRRVVYPSYGINCTECPGVLIVSYTWSQDASRIACLSDKEIEKMCLKNLKKIYGDIIEKEYLGLFHAFRWHEHEYAQGAYALFGPGQYTTYYTDLIQSELGGKLHFAGEATSLNHAWVGGCLNSAVRSVAEILKKEGSYEDMVKMESTWDISEGKTKFGNLI